MVEAAVLQTERRRFDSFPSYHLCGGASAHLGLISLDRPERHRPPLPFMPLAGFGLAVCPDSASPAWENKGAISRERSGSSRVS